MSIRHHLALSLAKDDHADIKQASVFLSAAITDCEADKVDPNRDAAVLLLASHITFITVPNNDIYKNVAKYVTECEKEASNDITAVRPSNVVN